MVYDHSKLMLCPDCCEKHGRLWKIWIEDDEKNNNQICSDCGKKLITTNLIYKEVKIISKTSIQWDFYKAMMKLKEDDVIEFNIKLSQLPKPEPYIPSKPTTSSTVQKSTVSSVKQEEAKTQEPPKPSCPKCGSTAITAGARGVNHFWGFIGASKTVNRCANCGHMWKPGRW